MQTILICDGLYYPSNVGTIIRSATLMGVTEVVVCCIDRERLDHIHNTFSEEVQEKIDSFICSKDLRYTRRFKKNLTHYSKFYNEHIKVTFRDFDEVITNLKNNDFTVFVLENKPEKALFDQDLTDEKVAIIVGNENIGVRSGLENEEVLFIPSMCKTIKNSYNVATAASIAIYERFKQSLIT